MKPKTLADKAGLDPGIISRVLNRERMPSSDSLSSIARALDLPPETVFRAAGLLPPLASVDAERRETLDHNWSELTPEQQDDVLRYIEFVKSKPPPSILTLAAPVIAKPKHKRQGKTPGEVVNKDK